MKINKKQLQTALAIVKPGLAAKEIISQSTSFAFVNGKVITYNDEISISHPVAGIELEGAIAAKELYSLLGHITRDEVTMEEEDNCIILKAGRSKAGFTMQSEIKLPLDEVKGKKKWIPIPEGFTDAIYRAAVNCSKNFTKPILTCVHVNKDGYVEASDSLRLIKIAFPKAFKFDTFLFPSSAAIQSLSINPTSIAFTDGWVHLKNDQNTVFSARVLANDKYVDTSKFWNTKAVDHIKLPERILEVLDRAQPFYSRPSMMVENVGINISDNEILISAESETSSWFKETLKHKGEEELLIKINPSVLRDILKEKVNIGITENFLKVDEDNWQYICPFQTL